MEKWKKEQYIDAIRQLKIDGARRGWLSVDINARELLNNFEPGVNNLKAVCSAMLEEMNREDSKGMFLKEPKSPGRVSGDLTIKYSLGKLAREYGPKKGPPAYGKEKKIAEKIISEKPDSSGPGGDIMR